MLSGVEYMQARVEKLRAAIIAEYGEKGRAFIQEIDRRNQAEMERNERYSEKSREQAVLEAERYNAQEGNRRDRLPGVQKSGIYRGSQAEYLCPAGM